MVAGRADFSLASARNTAETFGSGQQIWCRQANHGNASSMQWLAGASRFAKSLCISLKHAYLLAQGRNRQRWTRSLVKYTPVRTTIHTTTVVTKGDDPLALAAINNLGLVASSAAWPIGAVVIAHFFRAEIASFIRRLRNFKGLGMEASLDAYIQEALPPAAPDPDEPLVEQADDAHPPSDQIGSPIDAIVTSWLRVMEALNMSLKGKVPTSASFSTKIEQLRRQNAAPVGLAARLTELRTIRNRVVHLPDEQISSDSIKLYIENANQVIRELKSVA